MLRLRIRFAFVFGTLARFYFILARNHNTAPSLPRLLVRIALPALHHLLHLGHVLWVASLVWHEALVAVHRHRLGPSALLLRELVKVVVLEVLTSRSGLANGAVNAVGAACGVEGTIGGGCAGGGDCSGRVRGGTRLGGGVVLTLMLF